MSSSTGKGQGSSSGISTGTGTGGEGEGGAGGCNADLNNDPENCGACGRACVDDDQVKEPRCIDGLCQSFCASGFVNITRPATGPDDGCEAPGRRAFVTEDLLSVAEIVDVMNADARCQMFANSQELGGKWRAWLSDASDMNTVAQRFDTQPDAPYMLLDFTLVAGSFAALTTLGPDSPINLTESLTPVASPATVWTGTTPVGLASGLDCAGWTTENGQVTVGVPTATTEEWTQREPNGTCNGTAHLYCFEQ